MNEDLCKGTNGTRVRGYFRVGMRSRAVESIQEQQQESQFKAVIETARNLGYELKAEDVKRESASGVRERSDMRPELFRLLDSAERGEYDVLVLSRSEDLFRDVRGMAEFLARMYSAGVRVWCPHRELDPSSPIVRLELTLHLAVAEHTRSEVARRVWAIRKARAAS